MVPSRTIRCFWTAPPSLRKHLFSVGTASANGSDGFESFQQIGIPLLCLVEKDLRRITVRAQGNWRVHPTIPESTPEEAGSVPPCFNKERETSIGCLAGSMHSLCRWNEKEQIWSRLKLAW